MAIFRKLWDSHPGDAKPCVGSHGKPYGDNQCAITMSVAFHGAGIDLTPHHWQTYTGPNGKSRQVSECSKGAKYFNHDPAHIRGAHAFANMLFNTPTLIDAGVFSRVATGNTAALDRMMEGKAGIFFVLNGWGTTDHIDLWDDRGGNKLVRRGSDSYRKRGDEIWFWDMTHK